MNKDLAQDPMPAGADPIDVKMEESWKRQLMDQFSAPYMQELRAFLKDELKAHTVYPKPADWFSAFDHTPFSKVKVVILGQDPYHGPGQAHGLAFSVKPGVRTPPSLLNIYKELETDIKGFERPTHGYLASWAAQGVLLLNSVLTVRDGEPASHQGEGWEVFTDRIIHLLNEKREHIVFVLWGAYAQKKGAFIYRRKHLVLEGRHPSPLSASRGFFGSKPFSQINAYLKQHGETAIEWSLPAKTSLH